MKTIKHTLFASLLLLANFAFTQPAFEVETVGTGDPILMLPGFATPGSIWEETIHALSDKGDYHLVTYAGFDGVDPIGTPWYDAIREELVAYVEKNELRNLTLIGHSMGGNLAVDLAAKLPGFVSGLILVDAVPCMRELMMPGVPAESLQYQSPYNDRMIGMSDEDFLSYATMMASNMTATEEKIAEIVSWSVKADRETYVYGYTDLLKLDLRDKLASIEVPTLILGAAFPDATTVRKTYASQYTKLKDKQITIVEDSRHFIMFDQPEWLYQQIDQYLSDNGKRQ